MEIETLLAISAGATFLLALAAFWAIWQNHSIRKEDRALNMKSQALDEIRDWAKEFYELLYVATTIEEKERQQIASRFNPIIRDSLSILQLASIFEGQLKEKADTLSGFVEAFHTALVSAPTVKGKPLIRLDTEEGRDLVKKLLGSLFDLLEVVVNTRIGLFLPLKTMKGLHRNSNSNSK